MARNKISPKAFGLALGCVFALAMIIVSLWVMLFNTGYEWILLTAKFYLGYDSNFLGLILGAIYGFIDGFIIGWFFGFIYNKFNK